jgi:hypothetical protein
MRCPRCQGETLLEGEDEASGCKEWICPSCGYYKSDSEAFALCPSLFNNLGLEILRRLINSAKEAGLSHSEATEWVRSEHVFPKRLVTPLNNKRQGNRTVKRKVFMKSLFRVWLVRLAEALRFVN